MGQKAHPYGLRLGYIRDWKSKWFARKELKDLLHEDLRIRKFLTKKLKPAGVADIIIERSAGKVRISIFTARPGIIIGRGGQEINRLRDDLADLTKSQIALDIKEVQVPQVNAQLAAENVAMQLEKRVSFRKAMKKAVSSCLSKGAGGIKIQCKGRLGGSEIARSEGYKEGKVPLSTFRADVAYGFSEAFTTYGTIGVKVWIYHGDVLVKKEQAEAQKKRQQLAEMVERKEHGKSKASGEKLEVSESIESSPKQAEVNSQADLTKQNPPEGGVN
ncbi:MAG: 30S ribosomal protein S3 [Omnitrophica bacterium RIFCSPLOWO2_12_FULL_44_17]|uniref:Small ribosomal subunit protein uS3 n=1 Tax=Candidatus Danuiimicrobium aquiferis TaxID=1801832 RepID=A0A1G1L027_9BACT|nr:MAG: 30S ribosomal protein S3 [Omnitrophica bacterium RIFCSPHIGHO2_02_FULL_45_28]OGW91767.1 MAG: 30S ribosomal protein S3 [Omnitrophica bacterium RIFCSPHIGHO2_12_FULL_44_12]OGW98471.1 MAG: 30S ribosomal protein S3 [Omnitrophica bacterium RIFCSPLOWO2_12_FULL_44_17]OGX02918.1 MAG: 30S ribosomal protein S3 [Omnitrophica bacterium RIFCSPLOWO2_02_FULL_44_11]